MELHEGSDVKWRIVRMDKVTGTELKTELVVDHRQTHTAGLSMLSVIADTQSEVKKPIIYFRLC